jgi:hypothetical protein
MYRHVLEAVVNDEAENEPERARYQTHHQQVVAGDAAKERHAV